MKSSTKVLPNFLFKFFRETSLYKKYTTLNRGYLIKYSEIDKVLDLAPPVLINFQLAKLPKVAIVRTTSKSILDGFVNPKSSWLRYERFCKINNIPYSFFDITNSDWLEKAEEFDIFVCHTPSNPAYQEMIESKIYILEKVIGKMCFPSYHEIWQYENKVRANYLYQYHNLPTIPTQVTHNLSEALEIVDKIEYPFITKTLIGASSSGVTLVQSKQQAKNRVNKIFSAGLKTQFPYEKQKDYFYAQKFINDATFDLRIMIVGDKVFGYYRYPKKGDFKASGSGIVDKKAIPFEAVKLAVDVRNKLNSRQMGVDLLYSEKEQKFYIIETSLFNQIDTPEQLVVDGIPGYYDVSSENFVFKEGRFWIQELLMEYVIKEWNTSHHN